jgi:hypothetical protein
MGNSPRTWRVYAATGVIDISCVTSAGCNVPRNRFQKVVTAGFSVGRISEERQGGAVVNRICSRLEERQASQECARQSCSAVLRELACLSRCGSGVGVACANGIE